MLHLPALSKLAKIQNRKCRICWPDCQGAYERAPVPAATYISSAIRYSWAFPSRRLDNLKSITLQLATQERAARKLLKDINIQDKVRAYGILLTSRVLSSKELMELLSWVRLGASENLVPVKTELINEIFVTMQPANLIESIHSDADPATRDEIRAERVRKALEAGRIN